MKVLYFSRIFFSLFLVVGFFFSGAPDVKGAEWCGILNCCEGGSCEDTEEICGDTEGSCQSSVDTVKSMVEQDGGTCTTTQTCVEKMSIEDGKCGSASGGSFENAPTDNLCEEGTASTPKKSTDGKKWEWECEGSGGGEDVSCSATVVGEEGDEFCSSGLVPCGRNCDDPRTDYNETQMCNLCHLIVGMDRILDYILLLLGFVGFLMLVIGGVTYIISGGNQGLIGAAKKAIFSTLVGFALVLLGWVIINTVIVYLFPVTGENDIGVKVNGWSDYSCDSSTGGARE